MPYKYNSDECFKIRSKDDYLYIQDLLKRFKKTPLIYHGDELNKNLKKHLK